MDSKKNQFEIAGLVLRVGLGLVFFSGGLNKLLLLFNSATSDGMVEKYLGPAGYVNQFFHDFLFSAGISPWAFLTGLSAFEFLSGVALILGLAVRPLSLIYGFLMWSFVVSLPVVTTPGVDVSVKTYTSPAIFVQIRDIALSGMMFVLFNLGSGAYSLDRLLGWGKDSTNANWESFGVLLRLSVAVVFLVGGMFMGMDHIKSFGMPALLLIGVAVVLISGHGIRTAGALTMMMMVWYIVSKFSFDKSLIANMNGVKREFALLASGMILMRLGAGSRFRLQDLFMTRKPLPVASRARA